ncbi:MAG: helix-turn-helix transcriptional regulator [Lachnospiraceae bacterium]|nr:helix-turn-helix transcriptional regulator [Lachnospiraceae bacterium]
MLMGKKIQRIRNFRGYNQTELAGMLGYGENGQGRITQFESGYRNPRKDTLEKIARLLDCNPETLQDVSGQNASELMQILFWMEEDNPGMLRVFQFKRIPGERVNTTDDPGVYYHDNDHWPAHEPFGFWMDYPLLNDFLAEWVFHKQELADGIITKEEYFEWKINWPYTCDDMGRRIPAKDWRKPKSDTEDTTNG